MDLDDILNLDVAQKLTFEPIPAGKYPLEVDACTLGLSRNGNTMYTIDLIVREGEYMGRRLRAWQNLAQIDKETNEPRIHFAIPDLCIVAVGGEFPQIGERTREYFENVASELVGKTCVGTVVIEDSTYNGETRKENRVRRITWDSKGSKKAKKRKESSIKL